MKIGRLRITRSKYDYYNDYRKFGFCVFWPYLWLYWYESEDEHINKLMKNNKNVNKKQIGIIAVWFVGVLLLNIGIRGFLQSIIVACSIVFLGIFSIMIITWWD